MDHWYRVCETSNREEVESIYINNRRNVSKYIYDMLNNTSMDKIFRIDNISFISYMINKEELFAILTCKNIHHLFHNIPSNEVKNYLEDYPLILRSLDYNPSALLTINDGSMLDYYCQLYNARDIPFIDVLSLNISEDRASDLLIQYPNLFNVSDNITKISKIKNIDLFRLCIRDLKMNNMRQLYYEVMINSIDVRFLDLLSDVPINHEKISLDSSIDMIKHLYSTRRPNRYILEIAIGNAIKHKCYDILDYLFSMRMDIDVWDYMISNLSVNLIRIYSKYYKLREYQIVHIQENMSHGDIEKLKDVLNLPTTCTLQ